jgi:hypothetical protein
MKPHEKAETGEIPDDPKSASDRQHDEWGHEKGEPLAPHQNRAPKDQHKAGPLPNQKK